MTGQKRVGVGDFGMINPGWTIAGIADFNHDGNADILFQNGQQLSLWEMNGPQLVGVGDFGPLNPGWTIAGIADFNNDGNADILLQNEQQLSLWEMNGPHLVAAVYLPPPHPPWPSLTTADARPIADQDEATVSFVAQPSPAGTYGAFALAATGAWTYAANDSQTAIQQLGAGQSIADSFTAVSFDGTASQLVTVTINGTNDVPTIGGTATGAVTEEDRKSVV